MTAGWAVVFFVVALFFLIFIHEMGHFLTAKWRGVKVLEFGLGLPPRIYGIQRGETMYSINWVPLGGFCKMLGEEDPSEEGSLAGKSPGTRLLVLSAGSLVMLLFPLLLFVFVFMVPHNEVIGYEGVEIIGVEKDSPAYSAGIQKYDEVLSINGIAIDSIDELGEIVKENQGSEITMTVLRNGEEVELRMVPRTDEEIPAGQGSLGVKITATDLIKERKSYPPWTAVRLGAEQTWAMIVALKDGISALIANEIPFEVGGVVAAGQVTTEIAERGAWEDLFFWTGVLSFNLGLVNLLPIPALDGGRIVFVLIEMARRGKKVSPKTEGMIHLAGFFMLIGLILLITYQDIVRVLEGESLLP
ncbi:MAG: M50 family metallopeptidase [Dehalococcoidia bacterium]